MAAGASGGSDAATDEQGTGYPPAVRLFVLASSCAAVALLATVLFVLLHHLGNQIPEDLAAQRFKAEFESGRPDPGHAKDYKTMLEYCAMSSGVLAGARPAPQRRFGFTMSFVGGRAVVAAPTQSNETAKPGGNARPAPRADDRRAGRSPDANENALRNAVLPRTFQRQNSTICQQLRAAANGAEVPKSILLTRYWWGGKSLYAIALRYSSVYEIRDHIRVGTYVAYMLLAISLLLLSPKMLLPAAPLLVFGAFFSGIEYWAGVANGLPYLWAVLFAASLALLMRLTRHAVGSGAEGGWSAVWAGSVPVYCFAAGTVSCYLWLGDGHTFLAATWIGLVVWFGYDSLNVAARNRRALLCVVLYGTGIVVCYILGQVVKALFLGEVTWLVFWNGLIGAVEKSVAGSSTSLASHPLIYLEDFYTAYWPGSLPSGIVPTFVAAFSLAAAVAFAVLERRRGRSGLFWGVLWIVVLMSGNTLTFLTGDDIQYRTARYVFILLALCLSCLLLSLQSLPPLRTTHWRMSLATAGRLSAGLLGVLGVAWAVSWYLVTFSSRAVDKVVEGVEDLQPIVSSVFDVYLDGNRLVYVKEECSEEDIDTWFFLHLYPADVSYLTYHRQPHGFANFDFIFKRFGLRGGGRCAAERLLPICDQPPCTATRGWPPYEVVVIRTGQYRPESSGTSARSWDERIVLPGAVDKIIRSLFRKQLAVSSTFDVYLHMGVPGRNAYGDFLPAANRLIYVKEACSDEDVEAPFFLHFYPADVADLPPHRQAHGFDNNDFFFNTFGFRGDGRCAAVRLLPAYEMVAIRTGQYVPESSTATSAQSWDERIVVPGAVDKVIRSVEEMLPTVSSAFDVYLDKGVSERNAYGDFLPAADRLVYVKETCSDEDVEAPFFLHFYPADLADLPPHRRPHGFDSHDFFFNAFGFRGDGRCAAVRHLPDYEVVSIRTGQYMPGEAPEWSERIPPFDVYLDEDRLVYVKEECADDDVDARFFLKFFPVDAADLPEPRRRLGFDDLDFSFEGAGLRSGGRCTLQRLLPDYEVVAIETGQFVHGKGRVWERRIDLANVE